VRAPCADRPPWWKIEQIEERGVGSEHRPERFLPSTEVTALMLFTRDGSSSGKSIFRF
jgi:hypothetical protein